VPGEKYSAPCRECRGSCCRYIALEIDTPTCKSDYDKIRWYLLHRDVSVFVDHDSVWHIEFQTPCEAQDQENRCAIYSDRPKICRDYAVEEGVCEYYDNPFSLYFTGWSQFEQWLESRGKEWRFKRLK